MPGLPRAGWLVRRCLTEFNQGLDMVSIRLSRTGAKKRPFYHIVATDSRRTGDGACLERLGFFNPVAVGGEQRLKINNERMQYWISTGAKASDRVAKLIKEAAKAVAAAS